MTDKLLPCPFCWGEVRIYMKHARFIVKCTTPLCIMSNPARLTSREIIAAWNQRPTIAHDLLAACEMALELFEEQLRILGILRKPNEKETEEIEVLRAAIAVAKGKEIPEMSNECREQLADYEHRRWSHWMEYMFSCGFFEEGETGTIWVMPTEKYARWMRQMETAYADLTEKEKASDRNGADVILAIVAATKESPEITDELKPCPFCGGEATKVISHRDKFYITCRRCLIQTQRQPVNLAIAAWNQRPTPAGPED